MRDLLDENWLTSELEKNGHSFSLQSSWRNSMSRIKAPCA